MSFHVLIIDDEKELAEICQDILSANGYNTASLVSYSSALQYSFNENCTYLLVVDLNIGGKSGLELVDVLRKKTADKSMNINMPIIFMSGMLNSSATDLKIDSKNVFFLQKPFNISGFLELISQIYSKYTDSAKAV